MVNGILANPFAALGIEFYGFLLPWIFTFAVVYGLLLKANLFGPANPRISVAIALVLAFFVTAAGGPAMAAFFINLFAGASAFLAGIIVLILFVAILGYGQTEKKFMHWGALIAVIIIGVILFIASTGTFVGTVYLSGQLGSIIFWLVIIIVAVYLVTKGKPAETGKPEEKKT